MNKTVAGKVLFEQLGPLNFSVEYCEWLARAVTPKIVAQELASVKTYVNAELERAQISQDAVGWILENLDARIEAAR